MIEVNKYYIIDTLFGQRVTKAICVGHDGLTYGSISPSGYAEKGDNCSCTLNGYVVREAEEYEADAWEEWYQPPVNQGNLELPD